MTSATRLGLLAVAGTLVLAGCTGEGTSADGARSTPASAAAGATEPAEDGVLTVAAVGSGDRTLEGLRRAQDAGVRLAVQDLNRAGGVLDQRIVLAEGPETGNDLPAEVTALLEADADVLVGALTTAQTRRIADGVADAGSVLISATAAGGSFPATTFRTAPSELLLATALADRLARDGRDEVALLFRDDDYGRSFVKRLEPLLERAEVPVVERVGYDPRAKGFADEVRRIDDAVLDAVVVVGHGETTRLLSDLNGRGTGPRTIHHYLVDGNTADYRGKTRTGLPQDGALPRATGFRPGQRPPAGFLDRLAGVAPGLTDLTYAAEAYDATVVAALAAAAAGTDQGPAIAETIVDVTRDGVTCTGIAECLEHLAAGADIDYDGVSGPLELSGSGEPTTGTIGVYEYSPANEPVAVTWVSGLL